MTQQAHLEVGVTSDRVATLEARRAPTARRIPRAPRPLHREPLHREPPAREFEIPAAPTAPTTEELAAPEGHRFCPTLASGAQPRLRQTVDMATCDSRQCDGYHKCDACVHQDKPLFAGQELPPLDNSPAALTTAEHPISV